MDNEDIHNEHTHVCMKRGIRKTIVKRKRNSPKFGLPGEIQRNT